MTSRTIAEAGGDSITDAVQRRDGEEDPVRAFCDRVTGATSWFGRLLPPPAQGGIQPEAFTAQLLNLIRRNRQPAFRAAILNDPDSFLYAATDCAALNLKPGEEYWFVPFNDKAHGTGQHFTGMPGWKGELQQIYRSGTVRAVKFFVVYQGDHFKWLPTRMETPEYEPRDVSHDRQFLHRVVAYAEMHGGGISQVVVFGRHEIARAKAKSKTPREFWESEWEPEMWMKTALHRLFDYVPHSAGFNTDLMRAWNVAMERYPAIQIGAGDTDDGAAAIAGVQEPVAGEVTASRPGPVPPPVGNGSSTPAGTIRGQVEPAADEESWPAGAAPKPAPPAGDSPPAGDPAPDAPATPSTTSKLGYVFQRIGWKGDKMKDQRRVVACLLAARNAPWPGRMVGSVAEMTEREALHAISQAEDMLAAAGGEIPALAGQLQRVYDAWAQTYLLGDSFVLAGAGGGGAAAGREAKARAAADTAAAAEGTTAGA